MVQMLSSVSNRSGVYGLAAASHTASTLVQITTRRQRMKPLSETYGCKCGVRRTCLTCANLWYDISNPKSDAPQNGNIDTCLAYSISCMMQVESHSCSILIRSALNNGQFPQSFGRHHLQAKCSRAIFRSLQPCKVGAHGA